MRFRANGPCLESFIENDWKRLHTFVAPIAALQEIPNEGVVVLLETYQTPERPDKMANIYFIDLDGSLRWQIERAGRTDDPYIYLTWNQGVLTAQSWQGDVYEINIATGARLWREFVK